MARLIQMKALAFATVNLKDGSILHLDPDHTSDNRARYPQVSDEDDANRLEKEKLAERFSGRVPQLDTDAAREAEDRRTSAVEKTEARDRARGGRTKTQAVPAAGARKRGGTKAAASTGARGSTKGGPGVETEAQAQATAGEIEGEDPTAAPAA